MNEAKAISGISRINRLGKVGRSTLDLSIKRTALPLIRHIQSHSGILSEKNERLQRRFRDYLLRRLSPIHGLSNIFRKSTESGIWRRGLDLIWIHQMKSPFYAQRRSNPVSGIFPESTAYGQSTGLVDISSDRYLNPEEAPDRPISGFSRGEVLNLPEKDKTLPVEQRVIDVVEGEKQKILPRQDKSIAKNRGIGVKPSMLSPERLQPLLSRTEANETGVSPEFSNKPAQVSGSGIISKPDEATETAIDDQSLPAERLARFYSSEKDKFSDNTLPLSRPESSQGETSNIQKTINTNPPKTVAPAAF
jgi:hypothetical protein